MEKQIKFKILGMDADSDVSAIDNTMSRDNLNIRFTNTADGEGDLAITNEKGTQEIKIGGSYTTAENQNILYTVQIIGTPIGHFVIDNYIGIFTTRNTKEQSSDKKYEDLIYIFKKSDTSEDYDLEVHYAWKGYFDFDTSHPIDCQISMEREDIKKVYWIDGKNVLRFLVIPEDKTEVCIYASSQEDPTKYIEQKDHNYFDVIKPIDLSDTERSIEVSKLPSGGTFPVGVIQYAFTFYNKFGSESNIFKITPLFFIGNGSEGAPSDRSMNCAFNINIYNSLISTKYKWDYLRIYSIMRTSNNGTPVCKRVVDLNLRNAQYDSTNLILSYTDTGQYGEIIDSTRLLYIGGERIIPKTIACKDGTLFLGNYEIKRKELSSELKNSIKDAAKQYVEKNDFFGLTYTKSTTSGVGNSIQSTPGHIISPGEAYKGEIQFKVGNYTYNVSSGTYVTIAKATKLVRGNIIIDNQVTSSNTSITYTINKIGSNAFTDCIFLKNIVLPNTITSIDTKAFYGCDVLKSITLNSITPPSAGESIVQNPKGVLLKVPEQYIDTYKNHPVWGEFNIDGTKNDSVSTGDASNAGINYTVVITNNDTKEGYAVVSGVALDFTSKSYLEILETVPYEDKSYEVQIIGESAFENCSITSITLPISITTIEKNAFKNCTNLENIEFQKLSGNPPPSPRLKRIYENAFLGTAWYKNQPDDQGVILNNVYYKYKGYITEGGEIDIPENIVCISDYAFKGQDNLTTISIPTSVEYIGKGAFQECTNLTKCGVGESSQLPDEVTSLNSYTFQGCSALTALPTNNNITYVGDHCFDGCYKLTTLDLYNTQIVSIGQHGFSSCSGIKTIKLPNTLKDIGTDAFYGAGYYAETDGVQSDGLILTIDDIKQWCSINFENEEANPLHNTFKILDKDNKVITSIIIPNDVTEVKNYAFYKCPNITNIKFTITNGTSSVRSIGKKAFYKCCNESLTLLELPNSISYIGEESFVGVFDPNFKKETYTQEGETTEKEVPSSTLQLDSAVPPSVKNSTVGIVNGIEKKIALKVLQDSKSSYWKHDYWKTFYSINGETDPPKADIPINPPGGGGPTEETVAKEYYRKIIPIIGDSKSYEQSYSYLSQLNLPSNQITTFKGNETYRIGIQFQDQTGAWSEPLFLFDATNKCYPFMTQVSGESLTPSTKSSQEQQEQQKTVQTYNNEVKAVKPEDDERPQYFQPFPGSSEGITNIDGGEEHTNSQSSSDSSNSTMSKTVKTSDVVAALPFGNIPIEMLGGDRNFSNIKALKEAGYIRARALIVYPNDGNKEVVLQGVCNPTIAKVNRNFTYNVDNAQPEDYADYIIPSWYYRAIPSTNALNHYTNNNTRDDYNFSIFPANSHPCYGHKNHIPVYSPQHYRKNNPIAEFQYQTESAFILDWNIVTIDSPDLRFNEQLSVTDLSDVSMRVVGYIDILGNAASFKLATEGDMEVVFQSKNDAWIYSAPFREKMLPSPESLTSSIKSTNYGGILLNSPLWIEAISCRAGGSSDPLNQDPDNRHDEAQYHEYDNNANSVAQWWVYPWHRNGSMNNCSSVGHCNVEGRTRSSMLKRKIFANSRFALLTQYGDIKYQQTQTIQKNPIFSISSIKVFNQKSENQIYRLSNGKAFKNSLDIVMPASGTPSYAAIGALGDGTIKYYYLDGSTAEYTFTEENVRKGFFTKKNIINEYRYQDPIIASFGDRSQCNNSSDPIPMQFKTGSNCIVEINTIEGGTGALSSKFPYSDLRFPVLKISNSGLESYDYKSISTLTLGSWLPVVELYRQVKNKFGGTTEDALKQNAWVVAGPPVLLPEVTQNNLGLPVLKGNTHIFWDYGDTYFQRYDCLKTYPWSDSSKNNIIEILSFMCETRINIDGRYDLNRGLIDNTAIVADNFNLVNDVYTQKDNYFEYYIGDESLTQLSSYPNQVIWSMTKKSGDEIDAWTNITLLNYLDLDGDKGEIRAIKNFNNQLVVFQDSGISLLKYNQDVLLNQQEGVPIEIANSGKVTGSTYLSTNQGCISKWSIIDVSEGLVFIDALNKKFNLFNGREITDLGEKAKFQSWVKEKCGSLKEWTPEWLNEDTVTLLYDKQVNEILIVGKDFTAAYNLGTFRFTSFYSYDATPWLIHTGNKSLLVHKDQDTNWKLWSIREGDYNKFFNKIEPFKIKLVANDTKDFDSMKLFSTLEIRDNVLASTENGLQKIYAFDKIKVDNSYQTSAEEALTYERNKPSNLKPKFRTWRIKIPRAASNNKGRIKDRMMDHYLNVELIHNNEDTNQIKIHDIIAKYIV